MKVPLTVHHCMMCWSVCFSLLTTVLHNSRVSSSDKTPAALAARTEAPARGMEVSLEKHTDNYWLFIHLLNNKQVSFHKSAMEIHK